MNLEQLTRIYNTLFLVHTKGEDTIIMGDCLKAFKEWLEQAASAQAVPQTNDVKED